MSTPSLKINALSNWISLSVNIAVGFFLTPFIIHSLGKTGYGIWTLIGSFIGYYGLVNLGVGSAITRYVARYTAQKDLKSLCQVVSTTMAMFIGTGTLIIMLSFILAGTIADFFKVTPENKSSFINLVQIVSITVGLGFSGNLFSGIITAREHYVAKNITVVFQELLRAGMTILFVNKGWGLIGVGLAPLISETIGLIVNFVLFKMYAADIELRLNHTNWNTLRMLLVYGGVATVISIADIMRINLDSLVIGKWVSVEAVGIYGVGALIIRYMTRIITSTTVVLRPRFSSLEGKGSTVQLQELFLRSLTITSFISFGLSFFAVTFGPKFILFWAGKDYSGAIPILLILSIPYAFALSQAPAIGLMYAINKHHYYAIFTILEGFANLTLSIFLAKRYGIAGVALGTAIPMIIIKCFVMPVYVSKIINISLYEYLRTFLRPLFVVIGFLALFYVFDLGTLLLNSNLILYFVVFLFFGIIYLSTFFFSCMKKTNKLGAI